jgi:hypothetical protein
MMKEQASWLALKTGQGIIKWSGRYGLFTNHFVEILTAGKCMAEAPFSMNKLKRDVMKRILKGFLERGIVETSKFSWNASAFLVKKQLGLGESTPSKLWLTGKDYRQLNKAIANDVFEPPSREEIINIVRSKNKFYCSIDQRQRHHHINTKASDFEKPCFSTEGLAGNLQYRVLLYMFKPRGQAFQRTIEKVPSR